MHSCMNSDWPAIYWRMNLDVEIVTAPPGTIWSAFLTALHDSTSATYFSHDLRNASADKRCQEIQISLLTRFSTEFNHCIKICPVGVWCQLVSFPQRLADCSSNGSSRAMKLSLSDEADKQKTRLTDDDHKTLDALPLIAADEMEQNRLFNSKLQHFSRQSIAQQFHSHGCCCYQVDRQTKVNLFRKRSTCRGQVFGSFKWLTSADKKSKASAAAVSAPIPLSSKLLALCWKKFYFAVCLLAF